MVKLKHFKTLYLYWGYFYIVRCLVIVGVVVFLGFFFLIMGISKQQMPLIL